MSRIAAPDPNTRKPRFAMPPGACDAHCHIFGPGARFPYAADRAYTPPDAPFEDLVRLHQVLGIERAVIVHASCHGTDMRATLDGIARSGGRFRGTAIIDESCSAGDFERMHEGGIRAVRFNFVKHLGGRPDFGFFHRTVDRLKALGWHLILHLDANDIIEFEAMFRKIPVPMVIDHMARVAAADGLEQKPFRVLLDFMKNENTWVKVCGAVRQGADRGRAGPHPVGHRLAASQRQAHAERRRPCGPDSTDGTRSSAAEKNPGRQPGAAVRILMP
jgi:predicted TIM-barrel fold metal-dependent hydrolase